MMEETRFKVGEVIDNRYRVRSVIGSGGMGILYRVSDEATQDASLALKTVRLDGHTIDSPESVQRFQREFQVLTQLRHPNLVQVFDYGITAQGQLYFTMEWIQGQDLTAHMRRTSLIDGIPVMIQVCRALAYLHARGVIHGDLKPTNVLLPDGQQVKLIDFGVALEARAPETHTRYYSPGYTAPEVRQMRPVDHRIDLYSLGAMWYEWLVGEPPLFTPGSERLIPFTLTETLEAQDHVPEALGDVIARLLATSPSERYASANQVIQAINQATGSAYALETQETAGSYALRTHFVGRQAEMDTLLHVWTQAQTAEGKLVLIGGQAGVGKTRLVEELEIQAELEGARVVWGQCVERGGGAYHPWREVLRVVVRYVEDADEATMKRVGPVLAALLPELWQCPYMADAAPPAELDPQAAQQRLHDAIAQVLQAAGRLRPTMVAIEDTHWADEATLALLSFLTRIPAQTGLLVCTTYRSEEIDPQHPLATLAGAHVLRIQLAPLLPEVTADLARSMLGLDELPPLLADKLQRTTGGNALFVQELIRSLAVEGEVLQRTVEGWHIDGQALREARLPDSIRQVVERRLGHLPAETRQVLRWAAVMGLVFWDGGIVEVGQMTQAQVQAGLQAAMDQGLVLERDETAFAGQREYLFTNPTVREVSYDGIPQDEHQQVHRRAAAWLIAHSDEETGEHLGLIADHLERAGQTQQAVTYLRKAGEQAAAQFANVEAISYLSHALELILEDDLAGRYALLLAREKVYDLQGAREAQAQDLATLDELAEALDDPSTGPWSFGPGTKGSGQAARRTEVALRRANYAETTGDYPGAIVAAQAAIRLARAAQDVFKEATGLYVWGDVLQHRAEYEAARMQLEQALTLVRAASLDQLEAHNLRLLGRIFFRQRNYAQAEVCCKQALRIYGELGHRQGESRTFNILGLVFFEQGECAEGRVHYEQALRIAREIGDRRIEGIVINNLGEVFTYLGDYARARAHLELALQISREISDRRGESCRLDNLGLVFTHQGDCVKARSYCEQAVGIAREFGGRRVQGDALTFLGHALAGLACLSEAADAYRQALALRRELGQHNLAMEALAGLACVSLAQGNLPKAQAQVEEILSYLETDDLNSTYEPFKVYLACYRVLDANEDPCAQTILKEAHSLLQEQAAKIDDEALRRSFLENVPAHREIMSAFAKGQ